MQFSALGMLILVSTSRFVAGFQIAQRQVRPTSSSSKLHANFLENLQKSFSTASLAGGSSSMSKYFTVGITGSGGLVGTALRDELSRRQTVNGKPVRVVRLSRGTVAEDKKLEDVATETILTWNPNGATADAIISPAVAGELDAVVHLSGENVATGLGPLGFLGLRPWTEEKKAEILNSRTIPTRALAKVVAASNKPQALLTASGVGVYGDNFIGDEMEAVDETMDTSGTKGFLADVSRAWEAATLEAVKGKNRVVNMRFGVVMSTKGGALAKLYPIFLLGGGGDVGSGNQYFSFVSARDIARAIVHTLETPSLKGPVNICAPNPCTNSEFTKALGGALNRPTIIPLPSFAVSFLFGEMGEEMLLGGVRCVPGKLMKSGFQFEHPTIDAAIKSALEEDI
jgi:uncharacterized protein